MTDAGTTQDNFILPAPPVGELTISQDWLDIIKLVRNRTIPIILPSGKSVLVDIMFKIIIGYTKYLFGCSSNFSLANTTPSFVQILL